MRVLYLTEETISVDGPLVRGGAIHVRKVVDGLRERGHSVSLLDWNNDETSENHRTVRPWTRFVDGALRTAVEGVRFGHQQRVDVVVSKTRKSYLPGLVAARILGVPHVVHVGSLPEAVDTGFSSKADNASFVARLRLPHDGYLAVCRAIAESLERRGVPSDRIYDIGNAVDTDRFQPDPQVDLPRSVDRELPDGPLVGFVGGLRTYKGVRDLVAASNETSADHSLVFVGDGPQRPLLESELNASDVLLGPVDYEYMPAIYDAFDVVALPSHTEGLPRVVLEAQATETAVVATSVGGVPEVIEDGETGTLVPPRSPGALASALDHLLVNPTVRKEQGRRARTAVVGRYSWSALTDRTERVLDDVVEAA